MRFQEDVITLNAAIDACGKGGQWQFALMILAEFGAKQLEPNIVSCSSAVSACEEAKEWQQALFLLFYALDHSCADRMTCNAAISACGLGSKWPRSLAVLDFMKGSPLALHPSVVTYNSAISACDTAELWYKALNLFETCCEGLSAETWFEPGWETPQRAHKIPEILELESTRFFDVNRLRRVPATMERVILAQQGHHYVQRCHQCLC